MIAEGLTGALPVISTRYGGGLMVRLSAAISALIADKMRLIKSAMVNFNLYGDNMRKIEQWLLQVIKTTRDNAHLLKEQINTKDNTTVITRIREDGAVVTTIYLHGKMIAQCGALGWGFKMAG